MNVSKKLAIVAMSGLLLSTVSAWAGSTEQAPVQASAVSGEQSVLGFLKPLMATANIRAAQRGCRPDTLYSSHDVVGDKEACFQNKIDVRNGSTNPSFGGGVL